MMKIKKGLILLTVGSMLMVTGCSYMQMEDNVKDNIKNIGQETKDTQKDDVQENEKEAGTLEAGESFSVGESIIWSDYFDQQIRYTLEGVEVYSNLSDLGIAKEELVTIGQSQVSEQGELIDSQSVLVAADIKIENINFQSYDNGKSEDKINQVRVDCYGKSAEELKQGVGGEEAVYFSLHSPEEKDYYKFILKQGEEATVRLVWIVPKEVYQKPFYYMIGSGMGEEAGQYFLLNQIKE